MTPKEVLSVFERDPERACARVSVAARAHALSRTTAAGLILSAMMGMPAAAAVAQGVAGPPATIPRTSNNSPASPSAPQQQTRPTGVRGVVTQHGDPLPGIDVMAIKEVEVKVGAAPPELLTKTTTDANGAYSFEDLAPGIYTLSFFARGLHVQPGRDNAQWQIAEVDVCPGSMLERNSQPMGAFVGRVAIPRAEGQQQLGTGRTGMSGEMRGQAGNAIAGGRVVATRLDDHSTRSTLTDQSGAYVLDGLQPGAY
jgi:hypothetical protein